MVNIVHLDNIGIPQVKSALQYQIQDIKPYQYIRSCSKRHAGMIRQLSAINQVKTSLIDMTSQ